MSDKHCLIHTIELNNMNVVVDFETESANGCHSLNIGFTTRVDGMHSTKISLWNITSSDIDELISTLKEVKKDIKRLGDK